MIDCNPNSLASLAFEAGFQGLTPQQSMAVKTFLLCALNQPSNPPAVPVSDDATDANASQFTAHWNIAIGASGYRLDVSTVSNFASFVAGYNNRDVLNVTQFNVTGLTADTDYFYRVRAYNGSGTSASSATITLHTDPAVNPGDPQVTFTLTAPQYYIQGEGTDIGAQNVTPVRALTKGTHTIPLTEYFNGGHTVNFFSLMVAFLDTLTDWNQNGGFSGGGGFVILYESDDAPDVWQATMIIPSSFTLHPTFHEIAADIIADGQVPITSLTPANLPSP